MCVFMYACTWRVCLDVCITYTPWLPPCTDLHVQCISIACMITTCGCHASIQHWSRDIIRRFPASYTSIIADSYAVVFPPNVVSKLYVDIDYCSAYFLSDAQRDMCKAGTLDVQHAVIDTLESHPNVPFAFVQVIIAYVHMTVMCI